MKYRTRTPRRTATQCPNPESAASSSPRHAKSVAATEENLIPPTPRLDQEDSHDLESAVGERHRRPPSPRDGDPAGRPGVSTSVVRPAGISLLARTVPVARSSTIACGDVWPS